MTMGDAYAVLVALVLCKMAAGAQQTGWKIGLTSRAMQDALKIDTPDNGIVEETGLGAGALTAPVTSVLWLARRLAQYGQSIKAGDIVLSGAFIRPIQSPPETAMDADFGPFGKVRINFA